MSLPRYPKYRDSGVEWLGEVPEHWHMCPLKHIASLKGRLGWQGLRADEYTDEGPFLVTSEHFSGGRIDWERCYHVSEERFELAPEIQLQTGDLLLMKDGSIGKLAFVDGLPGRACLNSHLLVIRPVNGSFENRYLYYVLSSPGFNTFAMREKTGTTFHGISQETVSSFAFTLPPIAEQRRILTFLDRETTKFDALVKEQRRLIELLKEKRQAVISQAVTKGLNPNAPMKPSGIDWLGDVPSHWELGPIKRFAAVIDCKHHTVEFIDEGLPVVSIRELEGDKIKLENAKLTSRAEWEFLREGRVPCSGDLILCRNASVGAVGQVEAGMDFCMGQDVCLIRPREPDSFFHSVLSSSIIRSQIDALLVGATIRRLNVEAIRNLDMVLPPKAERLDIAEFLKEESTMIDSLIAEATRAIDLLQERRSALISAAVTGKIDVRGLAGTEAA